MPPIIHGFHLNINNPISDSILVSAYCSPNPGMQYRGVDTLSKTLIFEKFFSGGTANTGNFLAIVHGLRLLKRNNIEVQAIYSSSAEAVQWVKEKGCKDCPRNGKRREKLREAISDAEQWLTEHEVTTEILEWNAKEWGEVNDLVMLAEVRK